MATNTNTTSGPGTETGTGGGGVGSKLRGAAEVIHGFGDNIRGAALGAADRAAGSETGEKKHDDVATKGREEFARGMAKLKGHPQPAGTTQSTAAAGTGTGAEAGRESGAQTAGAGVTGQGQQGAGYGASTAEGKSGAYTGPQTTGPGAAQTGAQTGHEGREAAAGTGVVREQEKQVQRDPGVTSRQEGKDYEKDVQERATDDRSQQRSEQPPQQTTGEQRATGQVYHEEPRQEGGQLGDTGGGQREHMNFQGIPQDDEGVANQPPPGVPGVGNEG